MSMQPSLEANTKCLLCERAAVFVTPWGLLCPTHMLDAMDSDSAGSD